MIALAKNATEEQMWIKVNDMIIAIVYGYIESRTNEDKIEEWYYELEKEYIKWQDEKILIIGDFNVHIGNDEEGIKENDSKVSTGGKLLRSLLKRRNLTLMNNQPVTEGKFTREDANGKKSILDMIIANEQMVDEIGKITIDESHKYKLASIRKVDGKYKKNKSDHNSIVIEVKGEVHQKNMKVVRWNMKDEEAWEEYRKITEEVVMKETWENVEDINIAYKRWIREMKSIMYKIFKRITIKSQNHSKKTRVIINRKKAVSREISKMKTKGIRKGVIIEYLTTYHTKMKDYATETIHEGKLQRMKTRLDKMTNKGQINNEIWKIRKTYTSNKNPKLAVKDTGGKMITDADEIKQRYIQYYKELLTNREVHTSYQNHNTLIEENHNQRMKIKTYENEEINDVYTIEELETVIKSLKKNKSPGPDEIMNELIINAGNNLRENILKMLNTFWTREQIPDELYKIKIKSIYKGKGETAELSNQRGLFMGSIILKLHEKMMLQKGGDKLDEGISKYQAGGRKNHGIDEQVFILRAVIEYYKYLKAILYIETFDLEKCFDKMVLLNIMNDLWRKDIRGRIYKNIYNVNSYAEAKVITAVGETEYFHIEEILKQGSVLATQLAAMHTDTISTMLESEGLGVQYGMLFIPLLIFQDDVLKFEQNSTNLQKSNIIFEHFQNINRMKYHETKTMILTKDKQCNIILNQKIVPHTSEIKYLGDIINIENQYNGLIEERKNNIMGTVAELVSINAELQQLSVVANIKYLSGVVQPKLLLNAQTWNGITQKDHDELEKIQSQAVKRLLRIPYTTPTRGLYAELGIMTVKNQIKIKQCVFLHKILNKSEGKLARQVLMQQAEMPGPTWLKKVLEYMEEYEIAPDLEQIRNFDKSEWKTLIEKRTWYEELTEFREWCENSIKCKHMTNIELKEYIKELPPQLSRMLLLIRLGMIDVKENYHNMYRQNMKCRNCSKDDETFKHFITCLATEEQKKIIEKYYNNIWTLENLEHGGLVGIVYKIIKNQKYFEYRD